MIKQSNIKSKQIRQRSPSYPGIDLKNAIERARTIMNKEGRNLAPPETILKHWNYTPKSSSGLIALAALIKFNLLEDQGTGNKRRVKLSDLAWKILIDERKVSSERDKAIKEAAISPKIHKKLLAEYKERLPSDENLKYKLRSDERFTDKAAKDFIKQFKQTISFANLFESDIISGQEEDKIQSKMENEMTSMPDIQTKEQSPFFPKGATQTIEIPIFLPPNKYGKMQIPYPLTKDEWDQMMVMIEAYKQSLTVSSSSKEMSKKEEQENKP